MAKANNKTKTAISQKNQPVVFRGETGDRVQTISQSGNIFDGLWGKNAESFLNCINKKSVNGIPTSWVHVMDVDYILKRASVNGDYQKDYEQIYINFQKNIGASFIDQFVPDNPLTMTSSGYDTTLAGQESTGNDNEQEDFAGFYGQRGHSDSQDSEHAATTGQTSIVHNEIVIDSPEAVVRHLEEFVFPSLENQLGNIDTDDMEYIDSVIEDERKVQLKFGPDLLC